MRAEAKSISDEKRNPTNMRNYIIELEIFEGKGGQLRTDGTYPDFVKEGICAWMFDHYEVGQKFHYPDDLGKLCPWLVDSLMGVIRALEHGGTLPWKYRGTPYEKDINLNGVTTEYVRCIDPTASGIVIKVTRTAIQNNEGAIK
jgi:uncharacterized repeat protein (TIGR04076 family)